MGEKLISEVWEIILAKHNAGEDEFQKVKLMVGGCHQVALSKKTMALTKETAGPHFGDLWSVFEILFIGALAL